MQDMLTFHDRLGGTEISVGELAGRLDDFLRRFGASSYLGREFAEMTAGDEPFAALLRSCGCTDREFFESVLQQLEQSSHEQPRDVAVSGVALPKRLLLPILEAVIPGDELMSITTVDQYEAAANTRVPEDRRDDLQLVLDTYPVRLSMHTVRQARISWAVGYQFMPFAEELDSTGLKNTWVGQFHQGVLEQMYQNRPIFVLHMSCPVYCRFCFRKHKDCRNQPAPTIEDVRRALDHIADSPRIKEIVLTGVEPLLNRETLTCAVEGLQQIEHIQTIRIASRCISYYPQLFSNKDSFWLKYLTGKNRELQQRNKRIEIATHFIHPDEISVYSLEIISELVKSGIGVYTQTPFLKDCNDSGEELAQLYRELRAAGSEIHYIYIPCSPIQGNKVYWTPLSDGHRAAAYLRSHLSDRAMPILCTASKVGKIDWNVSGWAVEPDAQDPRYIWLRTPYTDQYFKEFVPSFVLQEAREHHDGSILSRFMADIGDDRLFLGHFDMQDGQPFDLNMADLREVQLKVLEDQRVTQSIVETGTAGVCRIHKTRVELDLGEYERLKEMLACIKGCEDIREVVLAARDDCIDHLDQIEMIARRLRAIPHVQALRLRSLKLAYEPQLFDEELIGRIVKLNQLRAANPFRVEMETQFIHSSEFSALHSEIIRRFSSAGVTVYCNLLLLSGINDHEEEMKLICYYSRQIGIELFSLYAAGMPVQQWWNRSRPVDASTVITIATHLRRHQSGREVPLYVIRTALGDADFNLTAVIVRSGPERVHVKLRGCDFSLFASMQEDFQWPETVEIDEDGCPVIPVEGMTVATNREFFIRA